MVIAHVIRRAAWRTQVFSLAFGMAGITAMLGSGGAAAADAKPVLNEKFGDFEQAIADLRQEANQDRRLIVKANMLLLESEAATFWPLYDEYRAARNNLGDRKARLITDFLAKRDSMTQDEAKDLTKELFSIQKDTISVKEKYYSRMSKVLSARTVARFFQIDQKLDAVVDVALAARVPLIH